MTHALFIPANSWHPVREIDIDTTSFAGIRQELGCRMVEIIYPVLEDRDMPLLYDHVLVGDEEGRIEGALNNVRATELAGYPYPLVGDIILFGDRETEDGERFLSDYNFQILNHYTRS